MKSLTDKGLIHTIEAMMGAGLAPALSHHGYLATTAGAGVARAKAREASYRKAQAERLKDAPAPVETRQMRRAQDRIYWKHLLTPTQRAFRQMTGEHPAYAMSTYVNHV